MATWRTAPLPKDWHKLRLTILERDDWRCTWTDNGTRCPARATDVDHLGAPDDHRSHLLRSLCDHHHKQRTSQQANTARWTRHTTRRPPEPHPGLR